MKKQVMDELSDELLIGRYQKGDNSALEQIYLRYQNPLFNFIYNLVHNFTSAEDILQEVFIRVIKKTSGFIPERKGSVAQWLYQIALNLCRDRARWLERRKTEEPELKDIYYDKRDNEMDERIQQTIEVLPSEQKEVLMLRIYGDFSFKEIASLMECPVNTVLGRMHYALNNIRKQLGVKETDTDE